MEALMSAHSAAPALTEDRRGATRVLWMSTLAFTLMFAVWLMFGVLGVPIQKELGLSDPELAWVSPLPSSTARCGACPQACSPTGSADASGHDRNAPAHRDPLLLPHPSGHLWQPARPRLPRRFRGQPVLRRHRLELRVDPAERQGFALGVFGAGNVGASVTKLLVVLAARARRGTAGAMYLGFFPTVAGGSSPRSTPSRSSSSRS
jgi:NNP family nitrate/nitrite transporter-like MFS transporter